MFIFGFLKKVSECITFPVSKTTTFLEISTSQTFYFSVTSSSGEKLDLKIGKIFSKIMFFPVLRVHKNNPVALVFFLVVYSVNANMRAKV